MGNSFNKYVNDYKIIRKITLLIIFHYTIFKKQVIIVDEIDAIDNDEEIGTTKNLYCKI